MPASEELFAQNATVLLEQFGADWGVVDIRPTNRFGENVVAIRFVTKEDYERLQLEFSRACSCQLFFHYPLWPIGGLIEGNTERVEKMLLAPIDAHDKEAAVRRERVVDEFISEDLKVWVSWASSKRRAFVKEFIERKRVRDPGYANCGDKFLIPN
ncbi:MAG TPA: hypothetical protein VJ385_05625 [Fibrobacteria bacterium]|nr:hypothetical protein [Fibrobacteria bacterium]